MRTLYLLILFCMPVSASILVNNSKIYNQCEDPLSFGVFYPQTNVGAACSLGGTVTNPDVWPLVCDIDGIGLFDLVTYGGQEYSFAGTSYSVSAGSVCYFDNCTGTPISLNFKCVSNSAGIELDVKND